jgi:hypothetical protein
MVFVKKQFHTQDTFSLQGADYEETLITGNIRHIAGIRNRTGLTGL